MKDKRYSLLIASVFTFKQKPYASIDLILFCYFNMQSETFIPKGFQSGTTYKVLLLKDKLKNPHKYQKGG